jgi:hypothetical protein
MSVSLAALEPGGKVAGSDRQTSIAKYWIWAVLLFVCWQPFELGFYMDDWSVQARAVKHGAAFSKERFREIAGVDPTRPGIAVSRFILSSLLGDRPMLWQLAMLLMNGLVVVCLARAARAICHAPMHRAPIFITMSWLLLPWSTSSQFWTVLLPVELLLALFALLVASAIERSTSRVLALSIQAGIYFWLCTSYEVFYGQFLAIVLIMVGVAALQHRPLRPALSMLISLGAAQILAVFWHFESPRLAGGVRPIEHGWMRVAIINFKGLVPQMVQSMVEVRWPFYLVMFALLASSGYVLWQSRQEWATGSQVLGAALITGACVFGAGLSVLSFSLGLRPFAGVGVDNRNFILVSFWLVLLAALGAVTVLKFADRAWRRALTLMAFACGIILGIAHTVRGLDWASAWTQQNHILQSAPVEQLLTAAPGATVVLINPLTVNGAPIFSAPWDINYALPLTYPVLENRPITIYSTWLGPMIWDGDHLGYRSRDPVANTRDVYLWIPAEYAFRRAVHPFQIGQDLKVHDLP